MEINIINMTMCSCANCGISFAIPTAVHIRLTERHNTFYCPNGHTNYYPQETEAESLKKSLRIKDQKISELLGVVEAKNKEIRKIKRANGANGVKKGARK